MHDEALVGRFTSLLAASLPWVAFLPERDREESTVETAEMLRVCASIGRYTAIAVLIKDWCKTAEFWSDAGLVAALSDDISEPSDQRV